jgi:flagellar protein FlaI
MATADELKQAIKDLELARKAAKAKEEIKEKEEFVKLKEIELKPLEGVLEELPGTEIYISRHYEGKLIQAYEYKARSIPVKVNVVKPTGDFTPVYDLFIPEIGWGTRVIMDHTRNEVTTKIGLKGQELLDPKLAQIVEEKFRKMAYERLDHYVPGLLPKARVELTDHLVDDMIGLGKLELLLADDFLEEIVVNSSKTPIWVYHKIHGWLKTNMFVKNETQIADYANAIGRRAERQINTLNPLMDAHLLTGERVNATLTPISTAGNTITIRKFSRDPWTVSDFINNNTIAPDMIAFMWTAMQYEMNAMIAGGTASGKTSMLNALSVFLPPNQRVISIEDTKELRLAEYLHWVPMLVRLPNPEGKGGVSMLDLMVNSLRMRPDRILVGEIRRHDEAEVLFEAMQTGHSVYTTLHANTADEVRRRLVTPPLDIPETLLESLQLVMIQFRHRKRGIRRTLEIAELLPTAEGAVQSRTVYRWRPAQDSFSLIKESVRVMPEIQLFTGLTQTELEEELKDKEAVLKWIAKHNIRSTDTIGRIVGEYYIDEARVVEAAKKDADPRTLYA